MFNMLKPEPGSSVERNLFEAKKFFRDSTHPKVEDTELSERISQGQLDGREGIEIEELGEGLYKIDIERDELLSPGDYSHVSVFYDERKDLFTIKEQVETFDVREASFKESVGVIYAEVAQELQVMDTKTDVWNPDSLDEEHLDNIIEFNDSLGVNGNKIAEFLDDRSSHLSKTEMAQFSTVLKKMNSPKYLQKSKLEDALQSINQKLV